MCKQRTEETMRSEEFPFNQDITPRITVIKSMHALEGAEKLKQCAEGSVKKLVESTSGRPKISWDEPQYR